jgi:hypothetical protein
LKVDVRDSEALLALTPEAIEGHLENTGWKRKTEVSSLYSSWTKLTGGEEIEVLVPRRKSSSDYKARLADVLRDLEAVEGRSQLTIFEDLVNANADVLRIALRGPSYRSSLPPIETAVEVMRATKELMLAAACSTVKVEPFYSSRRPKQATDFIRKVRLGVSDLGGVSLKFLVEVPAAKVFPFEEQVPFARGVMLMLRSALDFTRDAQSYPSPVDPTTLTEDSIRAGVSANLCDALVAMCADLPEEHSVEVTIAYAPALPIKSADLDSWRFSPAQREFLKALGQQLRESGVDDEYHLVGFVHSIKQLKDEDCAVSVLAWIREKVTQVNVRLDKGQASLAAEAFHLRVPIECYGRLLERTAKFSLDRPHDLKLYSYPDDPALDRLRKPAMSEERSQSLSLFDAKKEKKRRE